MTRGRKRRQRALLCSLRLVAQGFLNTCFFCEHACAYIYIYIYIICQYIHTYIQTDRHTYRQTDRQTDIQTYTHTYMRTYMHIYILTCMHERMHACFTGLCTRLDRFFSPHCIRKGVRARGLGAPGGKRIHPPYNPKHPTLRQ